MRKPALFIAVSIVSIFLLFQESAQAGGPAVFGVVKTTTGKVVSEASVFFCYALSAPPQESCTASSLGTTPASGAWGYPDPDVKPGYYRFWATKWGQTSSSRDVFFAASPYSYQASDIIFSNLPPAPDLIIAARQWEFAPGSSGFVGSLITFFGTVKNDGDANASPAKVRLRIATNVLNPDWSWTTLSSSLTTSSLAAGVVDAEKGWNSAWTSIAGMHTFEVCADPDDEVSEANELNNCEITTLTISEPMDLSNVPEGALIRATGDIDVYIVKYMGPKRYKRLILNPDIFNQYKHLRWQDIRDVSPQVRDTFTASNLVRSVGDQRVWALTPVGDTGIKSWVKTAETFNLSGYDWESVYEINAFERDAYTTGAAVDFGTQG